MFFPEKIKNIKATDYVLEIGPGGTPHPRSDVLLEKRFSDPDEARGQRGHSPPLHRKHKEKLVYYDCGGFPFRDKEFDYVICSHVLEHVEDVSFLLSEISRVGTRGYIEYPTIYYDYIYNFPEHKALLLHKNNTLNWMLKKESGLYLFMPVHALFYKSMKSGYSDIVDTLIPWMFQGFEWNEAIPHKKATSIHELTFPEVEITIPPNDTTKKAKKIISLLKQIACRK